MPPWPGLAVGQTYYWQVQAVNTFGATDANGGVWWSYSTRSGAFTKSAPANAATGVSLTPTLTWSASTGATSYQYCVDSTNNNTCDSGTWTSTGTVRNAALSGLSGNTTYYWQVRAVYAGGFNYANAVNSWYRFTTVTSVPVVPAAFNKSGPTNATTGRAVNQALTWAASNGAVSYQYCVDTVNNTTCDTSWVNVGTNLTAVPAGIVNGQTYYWQVQAVNGVGTTDANGGTWWSYSTVPGNFTRVSPANGSTGIAKTRMLTWSTSSGATSYEYCIDTSNNNACDGGWVSTGLVRNVTLSLSGSTTYYWHVRAVYALGNTYANNSATGYWSFTTVP
ncbi:hypothetical protein [Candidatus Villigracilis saccharophilus]|uniref:hypothetical protein n=1 Tax=Candidatus Villigracilis saccharophilus TaxID=3140684 RepID=UPI003134CAB8|nr:hypothetical protein [Anaerolineales bacterium]